MHYLPCEPWLGEIIDLQFLFLKFHGELGNCYLYRLKLSVLSSAGMLRFKSSIKLLMYMKGSCPSRLSFFFCSYVWDLYGFRKLQPLQPKMIFAFHLFRFLFFLIFFVIWNVDTVIADCYFDAICVTYDVGDFCPQRIWWDTTTRSSKWNGAGL